MKNNFYVFRIAKGNEGGNIKSECPIDFHKKENKIKKELKNLEINKIVYNDYVYQWLNNELWQCGKLRQGWGIEKLNLRIDINDWIENYILGAKKYWGVEIKDNYCEIAMGRYNILKLMLNMKYGDIIFIPKHSQNNHNDDNYFTLCKVIGSYYFDLNEKIKDFGHVIPVKIIGSFRYGNEIKGIDFSGYYSKAISKIEIHHSLYKKVEQFCLKNNLLENEK